MLSKTTRALTLTAILSAAATTAIAADEGLWLHVRVDEAGGAKVTVNLPLALIEKAIPLLPDAHARHLHFDHHDIDADMEDLREMWREVRNSPDMTFVTVEEHDETAKVWKKDGTVFIQVRGDHGDESVDVRLPVGVVDAFLGGDELDLRAAVRALVDQGDGEFVEVRDDEDHVRVWVDRRSEAGE